MILDKQYYRKLSIKPILERLNSPELDPEDQRPGDHPDGLGRTGDAARRAPQDVKFDLKEEGELDGRKVWKFRGTWKNRQGLIGLDARPVRPTGVLPPYIPMDVTLYLGKEDGWPYKLVLVGRSAFGVCDTRRLGPDGRPIGAKSSIEKIAPARSC